MSKRSSFFVNIQDFPILHTQVQGKPLVYCDNAATTQKPQQVIDALVNFYTMHNANIYRGVYAFAESTTALYEHARATVARFIGANTEEIIFTSGTTSGINAIAASWGDQYIKAGDDIVITELEHHANILPWQRLAQKKGAHLRCIPVNLDGTLDLEHLATIITKKTKLVAVTAVSNALGVHVDLARIGAQVKAVGARFLIDAAQLAPHKKIDVVQLGCDFLVFSGHKMLGPTGIGVLFIKKELHDQIEPYEVGGGMVIDPSFTCVTPGYPQESEKVVMPTWMPAPHKFEAGTPPIAQAIGLSAAIDYLSNSIDFDALETYEARLCGRLIDGLGRNKRVTILGPRDELARQGHLVSFVVSGIHAHDVAAFLNTHGIAVRAGNHCAQPLAQKFGYGASVRVSFYLYNTHQDVDVLVEAIDQLTRSV